MIKSNELEEIKLLLGINYSDELKDKEILLLSELAESFLINAGWHVTNLNNKSFMNAVVIFIKYNQNSELPSYDLLNNKLLMSLILQNGGVNINYLNLIVVQKEFETKVNKEFADMNERIQMVINEIIKMQNEKKTK